MHLKSEIAQRELSDLGRRSLALWKSYRRTIKSGSKCRVRHVWRPCLGGSYNLRGGLSALPSSFCVA